MRFFSVFNLFLCFPLFVFASEPSIVCKNLDGISKTIMMVRQSGVPIEKALSLIENGLKNRSEQEKQILEPVYKKIVELAYQEKQEPTDHGRIEATKKFVNLIIERCSQYRIAS